MVNKIWRFIGIVCATILFVSCSSSNASSESSVTAADLALQSSDPWVEVENMVYDKDYKNAIKRATELMEVEGKSARGLTLRGIAYAKFNRQFEAYEDLIEVTEMDRSFDSLMNIGNALRMYGHCDRAGDAYRQALVLSPGNVEAIMNLTSAYLCMGDLEMANQTIKISIEAGTFPKDPVSYTNAAILKHQVGYAAEAREYAEKALQIDEDYTPAWQILYQACVSLGDSACYGNAKQQHDSRISGVTSGKRASVKKK